MRGHGRNPGGKAGRPRGERVSERPLQKRLRDIGATRHALLRLCLVGKVSTDVPGNVITVRICPSKAQRQTRPKRKGLEIGTESGATGRTLGTAYIARCANTLDDAALASLFDQWSLISLLICSSKRKSKRKKKVDSES